MKANNSVRVVITGIGVVSPIGIGIDSFWSNLLAGQTGIGQLRAFAHENLPSKLAAEVRNFDPEEYVRRKKFIKVMSRDIQLGVSASCLAMDDAGLQPGQVTPERLGVTFGGGRISTTPDEVAEAVRNCSDGDSDFQATRWGEDSMGRITPLWMLRQLPNMPACHVSIEYDARGPNNTITSRDSSALLALSEAVNTIRRGAADCMIVGACSSNIHPVDITKLSLFEGLSTDDDPNSACRPFDFRRNGTIVGEGAATFVVERYRHAVNRGADIYAEVLAVGAGCDGTGYENGAGGTGLVRAIDSTLQRSGVRPDQLGHVNAHGKGTQRDDLVEARAYHRALGSSAETIPITALKSYFGHFDAGSGAVELAGCLLSVKNGYVPATLNYKTPDPRCRLNVVHEGPQQLGSRSALSVNRTSLGQSAAVILRAV
ncbi:MAG: beta-ketoacyl-[acyl-carrier-protein] synthase family protein [Planctomycetaceae bacterium]